MTNTVQPSNTPQHANATGLRGEIEGKWGKISAAEIAGLKTKDELVAMVQTKYSLEKSQAQRDVDAFAKGRSL
jgi:uncharacterized protein YjbJ (UPF0337 family)